MFNLLNRTLAIRRERCCELVGTGRVSKGTSSYNRGTGKRYERPHWELEGRWDSVQFFRQLLAVLPDATTLFIEGTSVARDVDEFLRSAAEPGDYLPMPTNTAAKSRPI
jgi:hypothetical protein